MTISIIIATYNRAALLDECLAHLARQPFAPGDEVVVVDNGSVDDTDRVIERHRARFPTPLIHLVETRPGKSHALAVALSMATGDILAFTDDDVNVAPGWLDAVRRTMTDPQVALMGGRVSPRWERRPPSWLRLTGEAYGRLTAPLALLNYGARPIELGARTVLGANMAVRRDVIARVGGFATHLGKLRGTLLSGEDAELCRRVQSAGFKAIYDPEADVSHWVPAGRVRLTYFLSWFYWSGITNATMDLGKAARHGRSVLRVPLYLVRRLLTAALGAVGAAARGRTEAAVEHLVDVAFSAGYAAQRWRLTKVVAPSQTAGEAV